MKQQIIMEQPHDASDNFLYTMIAWIVAGGSYIVSEQLDLIILMSPSEVVLYILEVVLKCISIISLVFAIAVNWEKGISQIKKWIKLLKSKT